MDTRLFRSVAVCLKMYRQSRNVRQTVQEHMGRMKIQHEIVLLLSNANAEIHHKGPITMTDQEEPSCEACIASSFHAEDALFQQRLFMRIDVHNSHFPLPPRSPGRPLAWQHLFLVQEWVSPLLALGFLLWFVVYKGAEIDNGSGEEVFARRVNVSSVPERRGGKEVLVVFGSLRDCFRKWIGPEYARHSRWSSQHVEGAELRIVMTEDEFIDEIERVIEFGLNSADQVDFILSHLGGSA
ncbi:hypothetical protein QQF64_018445 [Cirrhinus molitorella]|uniref:Uncharacterized protein n=1 Tax=Cirrhinus molitorella TaxID=172907 RepID=A0ABR3LG25_9TELE